MSFAQSRDKNEVRIFSLLFVVCAFFLSFGPGRTQGARLMAHAHALLYEGRNTIDTCHWNTIDKLYYRGHYFTTGGPGMGYLAVPFLAVFDGLYSFIPEKATRKLNERMRQQLEGQCQSMIAEGCLSFDPAVNKVDLLRFHAAIWFFELFIVFLTAAGAVMFYRVLLLFDVEAALAGRAALLLGLGTNLLFYGRIPYTLVPNAVCLLLAFYLIALVQRQQSAGAKAQAARLLVAGLALGAGVAIHYIQIIGAGLLFLYAWNQVGSRRVWWVALGGLPLGLLILLYHYAAFDDPFVYPYKYTIPFVARVSDGQQHLVRLAHPTWERMIGIAFSPRRGLFVYNPVLLLLVVLMVKEALFLKRHWRESVLGLGMLASYFLFQASTPIVDTIWGIGPRYAGAMVPFLMLGVVCIKSALQLNAFYWLGGLSVLVNLLMVQRDIESQRYAFPLGDAVLAFLHSGPSSSLLETCFALAGVSSPLVTWTVGLGACAVLAGLIALIWYRTTPRGAI
jgi:hypothetical protein